jgi:hypothetical protein
MTTAVTELARLKAIAEAVGYRFERSADGTEERMIRPDGTVAVIARKTGMAMGRNGREA